MKIAIAGAGKLGQRLTEILKGGGHSVTLIDKDEELIQRLSSSLDVTVVHGNAKRASLLEEIGIKGFDAFVATTDVDEKNIVIGAMAKRLGVAKVIVRICGPEHDNQYDLLKETFGIDHIANPERSIAEEINKYLVEKYSLLGGILYAGRVAILEITVDKMPGLIGSRVSETRKILKETELSIAAISKNGKLMLLSDYEDYGGIIIEQYDELYVVGDRDKVGVVAAKIVDKERYTNIQRVMIAGGGIMGYYLARMLEEFGASVKIIEIDKARCQYLARHLQNVLVLNGDATDADLLDNENLSGMDAFVSATGFDEENLLLALMAKRAEVEDVIAKISRESFSALVTNLGVDIVLNPIDISANHIVRTIDDEGILSSQIIQGQAELVRVNVLRGMGAEGKSIENLKLPRGVAVVALQRGKTVILPDSKTKIVEGDRAVILSMLTESHDLEKLLKVKQGFFGGSAKA